MGEIVEYPFPNVSPYDSGDDVKRKAKEIALEIAGKTPQAVMVQGEMTMTFAIVSELKKLNIYTLSAVSERIVKISADENGNTIKTSEFHFAGFREY